MEPLDLVLDGGVARDAALQRCHVAQDDARVRRRLHDLRPHCRSKKNRSKSNEQKSLWNTAVLLQRGVCPRKKVSVFRVRRALEQFLFLVAGGCTAHRGRRGRPTLRRCRPRWCGCRCTCRRRRRPESSPITGGRMKDGRDT